MHESNFNTIELEISMLVDAAAQMIAIYDKSNRHKKPILAADYALISGFLRPNKHPQRTPFEKGFDRDIDFVGKKIFSLYESFGNSAPYQLSLTEPTVWEIEISSQRMEEFAKGILTERDFDKNYDALMRYVENGGDKSTFGDDALYDRAKQIFDHYKATYLGKPMQSFLHMLSNGSISGLGNFYTADNFKDVKQSIYADAKILFEYLNRYRLGNANAALNNFIDSLNFAETYHLNSIMNGVSLSYVAPFPRLPSVKGSREYDRLDNIVKSRSLPASPLIDLFSREYINSLNVPIGEFESEVRDMILSTYDRAKICKDYLSGVNEFSQLSISRLREIKLLYKDIMRPIFDGKNKKPLVVGNAKDIFQSRADFVRRFEEDVENIAAVRSGLDDLTPVIGSDELLSDLGGFLDDSTMIEIRSRVSKINSKMRRV